MPYKKITVSVYIRINDRSYKPADIRKDYPQGTTFVLRYTDPATGKRKWETLAGLGVNMAFIAAKNRQSKLKKRGESAAVPAPAASPDKGRKTLSAAIDKYMEDVRNSKAKDTAQRYNYVVRQFAASCTKRYVDEVRVDDLKAYVGRLRQDGIGDHTIDNRLTYVGVFLRANKVKDEDGEPVSLHQRYDEKIVEAYSREDVDAFMQACDEDERELFQFFLCTGMRDQEVANALYTDINFKDGYVTVKMKYGWTTKGRKERRIPVPDHLLEMMRKRRQRYQDAALIFPNGKGKAEQHYLRTLKEIAKRAGLNCGGCVNKAGESCKDVACCEHWKLHKWRKTAATWWHEAGIPVRTIQEWLGHESIETTLLYLAVADVKSERTRRAVNETFAGVGGAAQ